MVNLNRPGIVWITGASKGIGREVALAFSARGWTVAASARSADELDALSLEARPPGRIVGVMLDVTDVDGVAAGVERIEAELGPIDLAILNAGTHIPISASPFNREGIRTLIETNLMGSVNCLDALLPRMTGRHEGEIAVVASMTGYAGLPTSAGYGATKAGLINMCEALRPDAERHGVIIRLINPGFVDTPLTRRNPFPMPFLMPADKAAKAILRGLAGRKFEITLPKRMAFWIKLLRLLPYPLFFMVTRRITPH